MAEAAAPEEEAEVPGEEAEVPGEEAEVPGEEAEVPAGEAEVPAGEAEVPAGEAEVGDGRASCRGCAGERGSRSGGPTFCRSWPCPHPHSRPSSGMAGRPSGRGGGGSVLLVSSTLFKTFRERERGRKF